MKNVFLVIVFCAAFLVILPQQADAQVSRETARLLHNADFDVYDRPVNADDFTLRLLNGGRATLSSYKGKVVLLNFWATWCPPCVAEMPSMETLYKRYANQGLEILAVNYGEDNSTVQRFIQRAGYTFPILLDTDEEVGDMYELEAFPTSYLINREGKIIAGVIGSIEWDTREVSAVFDALLRGR